MSRLLANTKITCSIKDVSLAIVSIVIPFIPSYYYIPKLASKISINKTGFRYWNPTREKQIFKQFHSGLSYIGD